MKFPQTTAKEIEKNCQQIGENSCLAMCYIFCSGIDPDDELEYIKIVNRAVNEKILDSDCTVLDADKFIKWLTGRTVSVVKKSLTTEKDFEELKELTPVKYKYGTLPGHWVVVKNGKVVFNSLINSINVSKGKPVDARIIKWGLKG